MCLCVPCHWHACLSLLLCVWEWRRYAVLYESQFHVVKHLIARFQTTDIDHRWHEAPFPQATVPYYAREFIGIRYNIRRTYIIFTIIHYTNMFEDSTIQQFAIFSKSVFIYNYIKVFVTQSYFNRIAIYSYFKGICVSMSISDNVCVFINIYWGFVCSQLINYLSHFTVDRVLQSSFCNWELKLCQQNVILASKSGRKTGAFTWPSPLQHYLKCLLNLSHREQSHCYPCWMCSAWADRQLQF